jgi:hypothetical protein
MFTSCPVRALREARARSAEEHELPRQFFEHPRPRSADEHELPPSLRAARPHSPDDHELTRESFETLVRVVHMITSPCASSSRASRASSKRSRHRVARTQRTARSPQHQLCTAVRRPAFGALSGLQFPRSRASASYWSHSRRVFNRAGQNPVGSEYRQNVSLPPRTDPFLNNDRRITPAQNALRTVYYYTKKIPNLLLRYSARAQKVIGSVTFRRCLRSMINDP